MAELDVPGPSPAGPPVCPRHPDQVSYVRCQRCERPVCPSCQRPAAVGIQCVDCVAAGAATVRQARTIFGGEVVTGRPMATIAIIAVCAAAFAAQRADPGLTDSWAFGPAIGWSEPWRVLTSAFLHGGMAHLVLNMLALWFMGSYVEPLLGRLRFIVVYLLSAVGGSVGVLLLASAPTTGAVLGQAGVYDSWFSGYVGASGAVFGLFGTVLVLNRHLGRDSSGMYLTIGINAVYGFIAPNVAWQAHLGGLVTGAVAAGVLAWCAAPARRRLVWPLLLGLLSVLVLLAALKYAGVPDGYR